MPPKATAAGCSASKPAVGSAAGTLSAAASKAAAGAKTTAGAGKGTAAKGGSALKVSKVGATKGGAKKGVAAKLPELTEEEKRLQEEELERKLEEERKIRHEEERVRKEKEQKMREETMRLIREEEDRIRKREEMFKAREMTYNKKKAAMFELAFDDELKEVQKLLGIADDSGRVQRNCAATHASQYLCACLADPFINGPRSATTNVEVYAANENDVTALSEAAVGGAVLVLSELLRHGASKVIDLQDSHGRTPLFRAAFMGKPETVSLLLEYGADASVRNKDNESPWDVTGDGRIKEMLEGYSETHMLAARAAREEEESKSWLPPPPEPEPEQLVPKTPYSVQIGLRQLADTIDEIRKGGKRQTLIIDLGGNAQTFLRYRDTNMLMSYKPGDTNGETVRVATLGALRFGKPLVVDNGDLPLDWATMASWFDCVRAGLWDMLCDGSMVKDANFMKLSKPEDGDNFKENMFSQHCLDHFQLIVVTRRPQVPADYADHFFLVTTA